MTDTANMSTPLLYENLLQMETQDDANDKSKPSSAINGDTNSAEAAFATRLRGHSIGGAG